MHDTNSHIESDPPFGTCQLHGYYVWYSSYTLPEHELPVVLAWQYNTDWILVVLGSPVSEHYWIFYAYTRIVICIHQGIAFFVLNYCYCPSPYSRSRRNTSILFRVICAHFIGIGMKRIMNKESVDLIIFDIVILLIRLNRFANGWIQDKKCLF